MMSVLGLNSKDVKSTRDKENRSNPKVNRGCPLTANQTSADCVQISLGPTKPYIPLGGLSYWGIQRYVTISLFLVEIWNGGLSHFFVIFAHCVKFPSNMMKKFWSNGILKGIRVKKDPEWCNRVNIHIIWSANYISISFKAQENFK